MAISFFISDEAGALLRFFPIGVPQRNVMVGLVFVLTTAGQATVEIDNRSYTSVSYTHLVAGVFKSVNGGKSWMPYNAGLDKMSDHYCHSLARCV